MDSNTDDLDPEIPPDVSPEELQEALRWLDEMAGRPSVGSPVSEATTEFPFEGLIEGEEGELPDWLRETPPGTDSPLTNDGELESRLDWLAKMAERESIEELPTLEWRQLTDAAAAADDEALGIEQDTQPPVIDPAQFPIEASPVEPLSAEVFMNVPELLIEEPQAPGELPSEGDTVTPTSLPIDEAVDETIEEQHDSSPAAPMTAEALLDTLPPDEELPPINDLDAAMAWIEELAASQDAPVEDVPSVADRALASKLLMEAGLSSDELDRLTTGGELALGDLSLLEGNTPINAFVAEEDFADTIVLVETMAAEQGQPLVIPPSEPPAADEVSFDDAMAFLDELAAQEPLGAVTQPIEPIEMDASEVAAVSAELPFAVEELETFPVIPDGAMAPRTDAEVQPLEETLSAEDVPWAAEEMIGAIDTTEEPIDLSSETDELVDLSSAVAIEEVALGAMSDAELWPPSAPDETVAEPGDLSAQAAAELDSAASGDEMAHLPSPLIGAAAAGVAANGDHATILEQSLRAVDALALPPGLSLAELDFSMHRSGATPARRNLPAAVEWLELALGLSGPTTPPPTDEDLVARMPDDPDAVLAWLEQMAEEDTVDSSPQLAVTDAASAPSEPAVSLERSAQATKPLIEELSEDDLLSMPEDPDAVMAWLEGLAGGGLTVQREEATPEAIAPPVAPDEPEPPAESVATGSRSRRRRGRKSQRSAQPQPVEEVGAEPTFVEDVTIAPPEAPVEEVDFSFEEVNGVVEERGDELPEAAVSAAVEEDGLLVWPAADDLPDVLPLPAPAPEAEVYPVAPPVPARPRRRGRPPKSEAAKTTEPAVLVIDVQDATTDQSADEVQVETEPSGEAPPPPPSQEATPPAKPASWVDLLKPLR